MFGLVLVSLGIGCLDWVCLFVICARLCCFALRGVCFDVGWNVLDCYWSVYLFVGYCGFGWVAYVGLLDLILGCLFGYVVLVWCCCVLPLTWVWYLRVFAFGLLSFAWLPCWLLLGCLLLRVGFIVVLFSLRVSLWLSGLLVVWVWIYWVAVMFAVMFGLEFWV